MKTFLAFLLCLLLCGQTFPSQAEDVEALVHQALQQENSAAYSKVECWTEGHVILGSEVDGDTMSVYLAASVGGYGFMGGGFVVQSGWGGPCTVLLKRVDGAWTLDKLLEIEDYSDIPHIMPDAYADKFFALVEANDSSVEAQNLAQAQAYLDSIGRTEPIMDYSDVYAPPSGGGMLTHASTFRLYAGLDHEYPLGETTIESLQDGVRYLYTRSWAADADGPTGYVYTTEHGTRSVDGTTGTETLIKIRKDDGHVLETIVTRVTLDKLTITLTDESGSACYVFDYDGWEYHQPTITREGNCGINTACLDQNAQELPGTRISESRIETQLDVKDQERFTILKDGSLHTLVYSRLEHGAWTEVWRNDRILPATMETLCMRFTEGTSVSEHARFSAEYGDMVSIYAGEEHPDLYVSLERASDGTWQVVLYGWKGRDLYAYLFPDFLLINDGDFSSNQTAGVYFTNVNKVAATFDPAAIAAVRMELSRLTEGAVYIAYFADAEPLYMALGRDHTCPVYVRPDESSPRAADGKAAVSLNSWVAVLCKEGDWLMVLYETAQDKYRTGWIHASPDEQLTQVASVTPPAVFVEGENAILQCKADLYDDPLNHSGKLISLPKDITVTRLWDMADTVYVEATYHGETWRGFIDAKQLK